MADILTFFGGPRPRESQGTGSTTNEFVLYDLKSEIIGGRLPSGTPDVRHWGELY